MEEYWLSLTKDIPLSIYGGMLFILFYVSILIIVNKGIREGWRMSAGLLLIEYVFLLFCSTVLFRKASIQFGGYDFHPFWSYMAIWEGKEHLVVENIMNVVVFIPVGLLLGFAFVKIKWLNVLVAGFFISITIEASQLFFKRGFAEFDDVFHNTLGCMIGYGIFMVIRGTANSIFRGDKGKNGKC